MAIGRPQTVTVLFTDVVESTAWRVRMGDETAISLPWVKVTWISSVLPITGGLMLLISLARLIGLLSGQTNKQRGHGAWSGSSSE